LLFSTGFFPGLDEKAADESIAGPSAQKKSGGCGENFPCG